MGHKIFKTEVITNTQGQQITIAHFRSAMSNHRFWAQLDDDGELDLPFFSKKMDMEIFVLRSMREV